MIWGLNQSTIFTIVGILMILNGMILNMESMLTWGLIVIVLAEIKKCPTCIKDTNEKD